MAGKGKVCQKLEMVKLSNKFRLQVTFSKGKTGLFKMASEISTLCGSNVAIIVFSPERKVFSFGCPSAQSVIDGYLSRNSPQQPSRITQLIESRHNATFCELNLQLTQLTSEFEATKQRGEKRKAYQCQNWWETPIEMLNFGQLNKMKAWLEELKKNVANQGEMDIKHDSKARPQFYAEGLSNGFHNINHVQNSYPPQFLIRGPSNAGGFALFPPGDAHPNTAMMGSSNQGQLFGGSSSIMDSAMNFSKFSHLVVNSSQRINGVFHHL